MKTDSLISACQQTISYRQGDILFLMVRKDGQPVKSIEVLPNAKKLKPNFEAKVIAEGETSGHKHQLEGDTGVLYFDSGDNPSFIEIKKPTRIVHEEHFPVDLPIGVYMMKYQRQYAADPFGFGDLSILASGLD